MPEPKQRDDDEHPDEEQTLVDRRPDGQTRVAVDIGGTFTDLIAVEPSGRIVRAKSDTTPRALQAGVLKVLEESRVEPSDVVDFVHGSTVVINAITERRGVRTALVTTRGFRDVIEIARGNRPDLYNTRYRKPEPFVPRELRFEITERLSYRGEVVTPLATHELESIANALAEAEVEAVAVSFLHAWIKPSHEARAASALRRLLPGVSVVASHELSRQWREYERTNTTVLSAYVQPLVADYLNALGKGLAESGVDANLYAMQSSGGVCGFDQAVRAPITMLESGPVAGVSAAAELGRRLGAQHVLTFDVGGTTAKTSAIREGKVRVNTLHHVERDPRNAGYPVQTPVVDIVEIGAGGGSVAWVDEAGGLHVGPQSAGADPGPACYGRGGIAPTLTDANLLAGRLDPDYFLGGTHKLDGDASERALESLGQRLGVDAREAARGVLRLAVAQMANALRLVTIRRGHDPREFTFVAFGGNGPLHATLLARELGIRTTVVPPGPGHFSAFGMLAGGLAGHAVRTHVGALAAVDLPALLEEARDAAAAELGVAEPAQFECHLELRYRGQEHTLEVAVPNLEGPELLARLTHDFNRLSFEAYALKLELPLELVSVRAVATRPVSSFSWLGHEEEGAPARRGTRMVDFDTHGGVLETTIIDRRDLTKQTVEGPCIVEEPASTTLVLPGQRVHADELENLIVEDAHV
jgi:N-methylhydantoinase A